MASSGDCPPEGDVDLGLLDWKGVVDAHAVVAVTDQLGRITYVNDRFCAISGYSRGELLGQDHRLVNSGLHPHEYMRRMWTTIAAGGIWKGEFRNRAKNGAFYWEDATIVPVPGSDGKPCRYVAIRTDITRHKLAQEAQMRLAAIVNSSDAAIVGKTLDGIITSWNPGAERILGYSEQEAVGQSITIVAPPECLGMEHEILARIGRGESVKHFDTVRIRKGGDRVDVSLTVSPVTDDDGRIVGASSIARNITEQKRIEAKAQESAARFRALADSLPQLAWMAHPDGRIFWYNQRWYDYTGTTAEQMEGGDWQSVHDPERLTEVMEEWTRATRAGLAFEMEFPLRGRDGSFRRFLTRSIPVTDAGGRVVQWFGTNTDVDALKRAEDEIRSLNADLEQRVVERTAQLEAANLELEAFSYSVSHDLRAPLRAVNGFAGIVLEDFGGQLPPDGRRYLARIRAAGEKMGRLIDDLLAFSRMSRQPMDGRLVDTTKLVRAAIEELRPQYEGRAIEINAADLPPCSGDPAMLKVVWLNLLSNAVKYTRKRHPAVVEIGWEPGTGGGVYFIRDNGAGFDMAYADKLFGVFQRLHGADEFEGTGVGLALVQRVIHRHGGRVWAQATEGVGATFYFTLGARETT